MGHQTKTNSKPIDFGILIFILCGFLCFILFNPIIFSVLQDSDQHHTTSNNTLANTSTIYKDDLDEALSKVSSVNKTIVIAVANKAYVEGYKPMLDLFLDGLWEGEDTQKLKHHILIVATDQTAFNRCVFLGLHCYKLKTDGVDFSGEKHFMSDEFIKMMWRRTLFLGDVLKRGYNFIFTDMDVLWLRNPFPKLILDGSIDLQISTDIFNGNSSSEKNFINTGFYMVRSNDKTIALFDTWYAQKDNSTGSKEQDVLLNLIGQGVCHKLGLKVRFLDTVVFSGFCQISTDPSRVATVHANCCVGIMAKVSDLSNVITDWKRFNSLAPDETSTFRWTEHDSCIMSVQY